MRLDEMDSLVGRSICTSRPRCPAEEACYGGPGLEGGCGKVIAVGAVQTVLDPVVVVPAELGPALEYDGVESELTGRRIDVDYGMSWLITEDTKIADYDEAIYMRSLGVR